MEWVKRWGGLEMSAEPVLPGVYRRREGGFVVRGSAKDPKTGRLAEVFKVLVDVRDPREALAWLTQERGRIRSGEAQQAMTRPPRLHAYAASLLERKVATGEIASEAGKEKWAGTLAHIFEAPFADFYVDEIRAADIRAWHDTLPTLTWTRTKTKKQPDGSEKQIVYASGKYEASVLNSWLSILRVVTKAAVIDYELPKDPMLGIKNFPETSRFTEEEPNSLSPEEHEVSNFLLKLKEKYPQHYVMALLGFVIGQRPSTLRPLRRSGADTDVKFNDDGTAITDDARREALKWQRFIVHPGSSLPGTRLKRGQLMKDLVLLGAASRKLVLEAADFPNPQEMLDEAKKEMQEYAAAGWQPPAAVKSGS